MSTQQSSLIDRLLREKEHRPAKDYVSTVKDWYRSQFNKDLPLANVGLSDFHRKKGWEHSRAFDVSLHPDSESGRRLISYLQSQGIPYIAQTGAVSRGGRTVSTGPHIHVGPPSSSMSRRSLVDRLVEQKSGTTSIPKKVDFSQVSGGAAGGTAEKLDHPYNASRILTEATNSPEAARRAALRQQIREQQRPMALGPATGVVDTVLHPVTAVRRIFDPEGVIDQEVNERIAAERRQSSPEVTAIRKEYGAMGTVPTPSGQNVQLRSVAQPLARAGGNVLKLAGGASQILEGAASLVGITPPKFSEWANERGRIVEEAASLSPLDARGEEIVQKLPEKVTTAVADTGLSIAQIILLKRATGLPFGRLMGLEAALRTSDMPLDKRTQEVAKAAVLGKVLERHLSRKLSAAAFAGPTAVETGAAVSRGEMSLEDAILQTAVSGGTGFALGGGKKSLVERLVAEKESATEPTAKTKSPLLEVQYRGTTAEGETVEGRGKEVPMDVENIKAVTDVGQNPSDYRAVDVEGRVHLIPRDWIITTSTFDTYRDRAIERLTKRLETESPHGITKISDQRTPIERVATYDFNHEGQKLRVALHIYPDGTARPYIGRAIGEKDIDIEGTQKASVPPKVLMDVKRHLQSQHPEINRIEFVRWGTTGGEQGRARTIKLPDVPRMKESTAAEPTPAVRQQATPATAEPRAETVTAATEAVSPPSKPLTGTKVEVTRAERQERGLDPVQQQAWTAMGDAYNKGRSAVESGSIDPRTLAEEVAVKSRPLNDAEVGALGYDRARLMNGLNDAYKELDVAIKENRDVSDIQSRIRTTERALDYNDQALEKGGREQSAAFNARKMLVRHDYSLADVIQRAKAAKGAELTPKERVEYTELQQKYAKVLEQLSAVEKKAVTDALQRDINRIAKTQQRTETKELLDAEFAVLQTQFRQARKETAGVQASGLAGIDPEGKLTALILRMAQNRIKAGVTKAEQLVDDIYNAIKDSAAGVTVDDVREVLRGLKTPSQVRNAATEKRLREQIEDLDRRIRERDFSKQPKPSTATTPTIDALRAERDLLKKNLRELEKPYQSPVQKQIAEMEAGTWRPQTREKREPTDEEFHLIRKRDDLKRHIEAKLRHDAMSGGERFLREIGNAIGLYRSTMTAIDASFGLRQGKIGLARHPSLWADAWKKQWAGVSNKQYDRAVWRIENDPDFPLMNRFGLETPSVAMKHSFSLTAKNEDFPSEWTQKIPVLRQSEQVFNLMGDVLRTSWFKSDMKMLRKAGFDPNNPEHADVFRNAAASINDWTGRTNLQRLVPGKAGKALHQATPVLNQLTFAIRWWASRLKVLTLPLDPRMYPQVPRTMKLYKSMPRAQRVEAWKTLFAFYGLVATQLKAAQLAGAEIDVDPDSPDFLKARFVGVSDRHFDVSAGMANHLRFAARMAKRIYEAKTGNPRKGFGNAPGEVVQSYLRSKESPPVAIFHDIFLSRQTKEGRGTDFRGDPVYPWGKPGTGVVGRLKSARLLPKPIVIDDAMEAYDQMGWTGVGTTMPFTFLGESVSMYKGKKKAASK